MHPQILHDVHILTSWKYKQLLHHHVETYLFDVGCQIRLFLKLVGWLVGCFGFNGPLRQYFSLYRAVSQREGGRGKKV